MYIQGQIYINKSAWGMGYAAFIQSVTAICVQLVSDLQRQQQQQEQQQTPETDSSARKGEQYAVEDLDPIIRLNKQKY